MRQFIVGIDLGTTHTVVAYAKPLARPGRSTGAAMGAIKLFDIEQWVSAGQLAALPLLPSVRYHGAPGELAEGDLQLPWGDANVTASGPVVIGQMARLLGAAVPGRLVTSAKSWLSHTAVDRMAAILPWGAGADVPKVSPVQASASYLAYVKSAWNFKFPQNPLDAQDIVLTVPASFDESARALTLQAAHEAGLSKLRLLEEPQAVFYDWLLRHRTSLTAELAACRLVLVCDVGGGTTDLSLIKVEMVDGEPKLTRIGVGNHLMLGGDNMDLALAHVVEARLASATTEPSAAGLSASRLSQLVERCRSAKELLLAANAPEQTQVTLLGAGARLVGGSRSVTLTRADVENLIVDGFFPAIGPTEQTQPTRRGIVEFGLPYARDPAITRHIAEFLRQHAPEARLALGMDADSAAPDALPMPDTLLLNGGVFHADALVKRLQQTLNAWRGEPLRLLHNDNPDVAVARGAVAYLLAQHGLAPKIGGGSARSYFLLLDAGAAAGQGICLLPRGCEPGTEIALSDRIFSLRVGRPVRFHLYSATANGVNQAPFNAGQLVGLENQNFVRLPPIVTVLPGTGLVPGRQEIPVRLVTSLTELGTLELHCVSQTDASQRWLLEFDLRHEKDPDTPANDQRTQNQQNPNASLRVTEAIKIIDQVFGIGAQPVMVKNVRQLRAQLERILGAREQWPLASLRQLFDALWQRARGRRRSAEHERVWLNLTGYCLRPGFGDALDEWRMQQLWTVFATGIQFASDKQVHAQWWTLWRRVAGGLSATEQLRLLDDFAYNLQSNEQGNDDAAVKPVKGSDEDMLRLGASLERIPSAYKAEVGSWLVGRIQKSMKAATRRGSLDSAADSVNLWALGRIGARHPFYGSTHDVVPPEAIIPWIEALMKLDWRRLEAAAFAAAQMARMTDDRTRDLPLDVRERIMERLAAIGAPPSWAAMVRERAELDAVTESRVVGESLPPGLKLMA